MRTHTNGLKNNLKSMGRRLSAKITYGNTILQEELYAITPVVKANMLKSVMKQLDVESKVDIPLNTVINCQIGVLVNGSYEYINFGNYVVYSSEKQEDTNTYKITCYDKMLYAMKLNEDLGVTYPVSIKNYLNAIATKIGLTVKNTTFYNQDLEIQNELYVGQEYTYRDILDEIAGATGSIIVINEDDQIEVKYPTTTNDTINEQFLKDVNVKFSKKYGPVNSIVLSRAAESDNVFIQDEESIRQNGLCEIKIKDNQIMNWNDRSDYLQGLLNALDGVEYYINDYNSIGILYYEVGDYYNIQIGQNTYKCLMLNDEIQVTQGLTENVYTEMPEESETDYSKADKTDRRINQTYIIVDKQNNTINSLVSKTNEIDVTVGNNYNELKTKFDDYAPKSDIVTIQTSVEQIITDTYTKTEIDTKLVDGSVEKVSTTAGTFDENGLTIEKTNAKTKGNFNETGIKVMDATSGNDEELLFAGYDNALNETIVRTKNLTVEKYFTIKDVIRQERYENPVLGGHGIGIFIL